MNQYESDYRLKQALEQAVPGVVHNAFVPPHGSWQNEGPPKVTYLGAPPTVTPDEQEPAEEGAWSF